MTIKVSLKNGTVNCNPQVKKKGRGKDVLHWVRAHDQTFTFVSLSFKIPPGKTSPFSTPKFHDHNKKIEVTDDNNSASTAANYYYTLCVTDGQQQYCTSGDGPGGGEDAPMIQNK